MRITCFVFLCLAAAPIHALTQDEMREEFEAVAGGRLVADVEDGDIEIVTHKTRRKSSSRYSARCGQLPTIWSGGY